VDGRETDFFEWKDAARYRVAGATGSMHRTAGALLEVRYGTDGRNLHVRLDLAESMRGHTGLDVVVVLPGPPERRARFPLGPGRGEPTWTGTLSGEGDVGEYAMQDIVEVRIPRGLLAGATGDPPERVRFQVWLERDGRPEEVAPDSGWLVLRAADEDPRLTHWSAL